MTKGPRKKRITIDDIARESGYSKTSVSFAFNAPGRISEKARLKILETARILGYYPDSLARNFSLQQHNSIGFLLPHSISASLRNPYIVGVLEGIGSVCQEQEYTLTVIPPFGESLSKAIRSAAVDGLITLGMEAEMQVVESIRQKHIPYVTIDGTPSSEMKSVNIEDRQAAGEIMEYLLLQGHRRIAVISIAGERGEEGVHSTVIDRRMEGYREALSHAGLECPGEYVRVYQSSCSLEGGRAAAEQIMSEGWTFTAAAAMSDIIALGCMQYFHEQGLSVPSDISVAGFDNIPEASIMVPGLTTVDQPAAAKGETAARVLFQMISGDIPVRHGQFVPHRLVVRGSVGFPKA